MSEETKQLDDDHGQQADHDHAHDHEQGHSHDDGHDHGHTHDHGDVHSHDHGPGISGFLGNELVAVLEIRTGRKIGSAAMVADGLHARTDGLTSLAVLLAAGGTWLGFPILDPIIGILIGIAILFITRDAIVAMWYRLMDAVEPEYMDRAEAVINHQEDVKKLRRLRMRWVGHRLHAEIIIAVESGLTTAEGHEIAERLRHDMFHQFSTMSDVMVHVDPWSEQEEANHELTNSHDPVP
jgi:cation diffusion facilitator family transporter